MDKKYLSRRINGIPVELSSTEMGAIVEWVPELKPVFPDVVDLIVNCPEPVFSQPPRILYWRISEEKLAGDLSRRNSCVFDLCPERRKTSILLRDDKKKNCITLSPGVYHQNGKSTRRISLLNRVFSNSYIKQKTF